ncbi:hypothetical protein AC519_0615 [Pseudomonas savastanoi]|nr:hypothetical protein AC519_0615 [Pseudomonas savastanoi]
MIWKLDRMGRSLKHLVELVGNLIERKVGWYLICLHRWPSLSAN